MPELTRIAIFGPESTGKTLLAQQLAEHFNEPWSPEFVREFWELRDGKIAASDLGTIALGQIANEDYAFEQARRVAFCDTELLTCVLWNDLLFPERCPAWVRVEAEQRAKLFDLYLFCDTDLPFVPDPQRCFPDEAGRSMCRQLWEQTLKQRNLPFTEIRGVGTARRDLAVAAVEACLQRKTAATASR
jgi:NadR type nicotinamide-nucleotide adenylyltransferase